MKMADGAGGLHGEITFELRDAKTGKLIKQKVVKKPVIRPNRTRLTPEEKAQDAGVQPL